MWVTETTTVPYIDIIVSPTTEVSTVVETVTVPSQVVETSFATTVVSTVTTTVTAPTVITSAPVKRRALGRRGRRCAPPQEASTTSSSSSEEPSSTSSTSFPVASDCPNLEAYYSACACITAVGTTQTVSLPAQTVTLTVPETASSPIPSTSVSTAVQVQSSTVTVTTPVVSTFLTATTTTTTKTVTVVPPEPTQTGQIMFGGAAATKDKFLQIASTSTTYGFLTYSDSGISSSMATVIFKTGQQPVRADKPAQKLWLMNPEPSNGALAFINGDGPSNGGEVITCDIGVGNTVTCSNASGSLNQLYNCGGYLQLAIPNLPTNYGCEAITWTIVHVIM